MHIILAILLVGIGGTGGWYLRGLADFSRSADSAAPAAHDDANNPTESASTGMAYDHETLDRLLSTAQYEEAIELFRSASRVDPDAFTPHLNLGGSLLEAGRPIEALEANGRALELDSSDSLAHAQMGIALFTLGHHQPALFHLNEAKRIDPGSASSPQLILADIYLRQGRKDRAISELEDFLALHPDLPSAVNVRKEIESLKGNGE